MADALTMAVAVANVVFLMETVPEGERSFEFEWWLAPEREFRWILREAGHWERTQDEQPRSVAS